MKRFSLLLTVLACVCLMTGCKNNPLPSLVQNTPTPTPEKESSKQTPVPDTDVQEPETTPEPTPTNGPTPLPTKAPRMIGRKSTSAGSVRISNSSGLRFRQLFLEVSGVGDWGRNLIPSEGSIHVSEQFMLYYPDAVTGNTYDLRFRDSDGMIYEIYGVDLKDMETAVLRKDDEDVVYLSYMSQSAKREQDTRDGGWNHYQDNSGNWDQEYSEGSGNGNQEYSDGSGNGNQEYSDDYSNWNVEEYVYDGSNDYDDSWQEDTGWDYESE